MHVLGTDINTSVCTMWSLLKFSVLSNCQYTCKLADAELAGFIPSSGCITLPGKEGSVEGGLQLYLGKKAVQKGGLQLYLGKKAVQRGGQSSPSRDCRSCCACAFKAARPSATSVSFSLSQASLSPCSPSSFHVTACHEHVQIRGTTGCDASMAGMGRSRHDLPILRR